MENDFLELKGRKHYDPDNHDVLNQKAYPILASKLDHGKEHKPNRLSLYLKNVSNLAGINNPLPENSHAAKINDRRNTKKLDFDKIQTLSSNDLKKATQLAERRVSKKLDYNFVQTMSTLE